MRQLRKNIDFLKDCLAFVTRYTAQGHLVKKTRSVLSSLSPASFLQSGSPGNKIINLECYKVLSHNSRPGYKSKLPSLLLDMYLLWFLELKASKKRPFKCF